MDADYQHPDQRNAGGGERGQSPEPPPRGAGSDLNHQHRFVAYRVALPILPGQGVSPDIVRACFRIAVKSGMDLVPTLRRVVSGELPRKRCWKTPPAR